MAGSTGSFNTTVATSSSVARKLYSVALFAQTQKAPGLTRTLTGAAPATGDAIAKMKAQTSPDMPIVRVTDLSKTAGDKVSVDMFGVIGGKPIMGDDDAEGQGEKLTEASMEIRIDLATKVVDAGGKMSQKRTVHSLRNIAMANLVSYFARFDDQTSLVHLAGARGFQNSEDWIVPLAADADFVEIVVNDVVAPSVGNHWVADGASIASGNDAANITALATTDILVLEHIDALRTHLDEMVYPLQPVRIADDPAAADDPMWLLYVTPRQWSSLLTNTSATGIRAFQQNAWNRGSYGSKHPLFKGEVGMWNGILVKKLNRAVRFNPGDAMRHVPTANAATGVEANVTIPALGAGFAVDRALLLGGQALANAYGANKSSDYHFAWHENKYNFERALEVAGDVMGGKAKLRFKLGDSGNIVDHGVMVLDTVVRL